MWCGHFALCGRGERGTARCYSATGWHLVRVIAGDREHPIRAVAGTAAPLSPQGARKPLILLRILEFCFDPGRSVGTAKSGIS
jgi:hypothetical protein